MVAKIQVTGGANIRRKWERYRKNNEIDIQQLRARVAETIIAALIENIPVWSGRTVSSIRVNADGSYAPLQGKPSPSIVKKADGGAQKHGLGQEPLRDVAESLALAQARLAADIPVNRSVFVTINSEAWDLVEDAKAPTAELAVNKAVVSEIAMAKARVKFPFLK